MGSRYRISLEESQEIIIHFQQVLKQIQVSKESQKNTKQNP